MEGHGASQLSEHRHQLELRRAGGRGALTPDEPIVGRVDHFT